MCCDKGIVLRTVPLRRIASVKETVGRHAQLSAFPETLGVRAAALEIDGVRTRCGDPLAQGLRRTAYVKRTEPEMRIAHERIARRVHPAVRLVVRIEERTLRRRLHDKHPFPIPHSPLVRHSLGEGGFLVPHSPLVRHSLGEGGFPIPHSPFHNIAVMLQREARRDLIRYDCS